MKLTYPAPTGETALVAIPVEAVPLVAGQLAQLEKSYLWETEADWQAGRQMAIDLQEQMMSQITVEPGQGGTGAANSGALTWADGGGEAALLGEANTFTQPQTIQVAQSAGTDGDATFALVADRYWVLISSGQDGKFAIYDQLSDTFRFEIYGPNTHSYIRFRGEDNSEMWSIWRPADGSPNYTEMRVGDSISVARYDVNNAWIGNNIYYGPAGFTRTHNGYASMMYFQPSGSIDFYLAENGYGGGPAYTTRKLSITPSSIILDVPIEQQDWAVLSMFVPHFVNYGSVYSPAAYYKDKQGIVRLRGLVSFTGGYGYIGVLPEGFRPSHRKILAALAYIPPTGQQIIRVDVLQDGWIAVVDPIILGISGWISLDELTFRAA